MSSFWCAFIGGMLAHHPDPQYKFILQNCSHVAYILIGKGWTCLLRARGAHICMHDKLTLQSQSCILVEQAPHA